MYLFNVKPFLEPRILLDIYHPAPQLYLYVVPSVPTFDISHCFFNYRKSDYSRIVPFLSSLGCQSTVSKVDINSAFYALFDALHLTPYTICASFLVYKESL